MLLVLGGVAPDGKTQRDVDGEADARAGRKSGSETTESSVALGFDECRTRQSLRGQRTERSPTSLNKTFILEVKPQEVQALLIEAERRGQQLRA